MLRTINIIFFLWLVLFATNTKAQFYVNMEGGAKWDILQTFATKGDFQYVSQADFLGGAILGYQVNEYLFLEMGVMVHQLNNNYVYKLDGVDWLGEEKWLPGQFLQFPLRLRTTIFTIADRLSFHPYLGIAVLVHRHEDGLYEWRSYERPIEDPTFQSRFKYDYDASFNSRYLLLGEAGLTAKYQVTRYFSVLLSIGFTMGSTAIHEVFFAWDRKLPAFHDEGIANAQYKGDQISLQVGVQCLFSQ